MNEAIIEKISSLEILDSRGLPTIEVKLQLSSNVSVTASVPSGASRGEREAHELRDQDSRYKGFGVKRAIAHIQGELQDILIGKSCLDQRLCDEAMIAADGTENKARLGANAILALSLAIAKAAAAHLQLPLYRYLGGPFAYIMPCPMMNIINGGAHADNDLDFQEFMIRPHAMPTFAEALRAGSEVFHTLKKLLQERHLSTALGDEGGFAPQVRSHEEALDLIVEAIEKAGYKPGDQISIALDCAASQFYKNDSYLKRRVSEHIDYLVELTHKYPIDSIEDAMAENDWQGWQQLTKKMGERIQLVGDDLFVTNALYLKRGFTEKAANAILIKPNQIGTLTEMMHTVYLAQIHGFATIFSHRSGETEDSSLADLAVAANAGQIKTGSLARSERTAKYNRLLAIESELYKPLYRDSNLCRRLGRCKPA